MRQRKIPLRKCVACQAMKPKKELIRVVRTPADEVNIDLTGKMAGRGAYLCGQVSCFQLAHRSKALDRALKHTVQSEIYEQLARDFIQMEEKFIANKAKMGDDDNE